MSPPADQSQVPMFIKAEDLHRYLDAKFVDVRDEKAYTNGHIYNAVHADDLFTYLLATSSQDDIDKMRAYFQKRFGELGISGREHVIVYEQGINNQYGASCRGFFIFKFMNHPKVSILEGGIDALNRIRNGPLYMTTESTMIEPTEYHEQGDQNDDWQIVGRDEVLQMVLNQRSKTWLLDVRDAVEWKGLSSSPYGVDFTPRKGRIPNAVWTEWYAFHELDQDKNMTRLKSNDQIEKLLREKGIEKEDHVIVYCFKGSRASLVLMKMKEAGYMNVKNYFASWNEWSRDLQLPVDDTILSNE